MTGSHFIRAVLASALRTDLPRGPVIALFHDVPPERSDSFAEVLDALLELYRPSSLDQILADACGGQGLFTVTFDDNFENWLRVAAPALSQRDIPATFFTSTGVYTEPTDTPAFLARIRHVGHYAPLSLEDLLELASHPLFEVGSHGDGHHNLAGLAPAEAIADMQRSKAFLETHLRTPVRHFAFPFGMPRHFRPRLRVEAEKLGFVSVSSGAPCMWGAAVDRWNLHRTSLDGLDAVGALRKLQVDQTWFLSLTGRSVV